MAFRMNSNRNEARGFLSRAIGALVLLTVSAGVMALDDPATLVSQSPLSAGGVVPSNVVLTPSVEYPTVNSKANIGDYSSDTVYYGYFDPKKCYTYHYDATEANRYFEPSSQYGGAGGAVCSGKWSGNWLNWATTQTIDGFRKALTGGLRSTDTADTTILEKARHDGQGGESYFPNKTISNAATIAGAIPVPASNPWGTLSSRVWGGGNQLFITGTNGATANQICSAINTWNTAYPGPVNSAGTQAPATPYVVDYNPASHVFDTQNITPATNFDCNSTAVIDNRAIKNNNRIYRLSVRVKVCVNSPPNVLPESNCVAYGANYKPEGLIQKYSRKMRFSVFGYVVDNYMYRDGGVLRANQKYVGPEMMEDDGDWVDNPNKEWSASTGVFVTNPNPDDVTATNAYGNLGANPVHNSGVINYINKFAQQNGIFAKTFDPVSELYYTASRYLRNRKNDLGNDLLPNIPRYTDLTKRMDSATGTTLASALDRWKMTDDFPVITAWEDPFQFWCQNTAIIGIGDVYTHRDKNLPGRESTNEEPDLGDVANDPDFTGAGKNSVAWWTRRVYQLENVTYTPVPMSGLNNMPYIAGLAYYLHTQDMRPDLGPTQGAKNEKQLASTHWVDVRENQRIEPRRRNQYWLAAKYGGFVLPKGYDSLTNLAALPAATWDSGESLGMSNSSASGTYPNENLKRPTNYYTGEAPDKMVSGLTRAFAKFDSDAKGSGASLAANSTRLDTTTLTFQAQFLNGNWLGQLNAYGVNQDTGALSAAPIFTAGQHMPAAADRNIYVNGESYGTFTWDNLSASQKTALGTFWTSMPAGVDGADVVDYVRGVQSLEEKAADGVFRTRSQPTIDGGTEWSPVLGDIVNSTPVFVGAPNAALYANSAGSWAGKTTHDDFASDNADRRPVVWVGANDGMLHAFDASVDEAGDSPVATTDSGKEVYAFIPAKSIATGLVQTANPDYVHKYFVDGDLTVADVYDTGASAWKTVLVGTMGRGGPGIFALDVTDPDDVQFLWELDESDIADLGHNIGRPVIAQVANGNWRVLLGNGIDSANGKAVLISIGVLSGSVTTLALDAGSANGLSAVLARDSNGDGLADTAYAGDLEGSLWKVTSLSGSPAGTKLFSATDDDGNAQPITAAPLVGRDPATNTTWVFFGTGKFLDEADLADTQQQTWYGIKDQAGVVRGNLVRRQVTAVGHIGDFDVRTVTAAIDGDMAGKDGWYMNLPVSKERIVVPNRFQGSSLIGTTRIPDASDLCRPTGRGYIMAISPFTGGRLPQTFFDANRDNLFNDSDKLNGDIVSGIGIDSSPNNPIFIENVMQFSKDDGTTDSVRVQGANSEAQRASWREVTNQ